MSTPIVLCSCFISDAAIITHLFLMAVTTVAYFCNQSTSCKLYKCNVFQKKKSSSHHISYKTEALFEYLNHTCNPAFAVHPCPSPIFCHQEDKSELRGATPNFLPRLTPKPAQEWLPANFTVHSDFSSLFLPYGYFHRLLPL